ncbi:MAG: exosortase/archaeosortase family protein [Phycisphaerae bacterium]|nr:exosortase/archaeosortase family protein [Phycisphaerae bacterium]
MGYSTGNSSQEHDNAGWGSLGPIVAVKITVIALLIWWFFRQEIDSMVYRWADPSWSHGFLIPLFSLYFIHQRKHDILALKPQPNYLGLVLLIACFVFYVLDVVHFQIAFFQLLTLIPTIAAVVLFLGGWKLLKYTWLPITYLVFAFPLPDRLYKSITIPMRMWAAQVATVLLNLVRGLEASVSGVVIDVTYKGVRLEPSMDVAEACSGMRLLMAFVALGVAMAYLHYRPIWQRLVLLASTVPVAILCNIVRVTVTGFIYVLWDPKYAQGVYHDTLGLLMLPLAFGLYGVLAWFMSNLFVEQTARAADAVIRRSDSTGLIANRLDTHE